MVNDEADDWRAMAQTILTYIWLLCSHCSLCSNTAQCPWSWNKRNNRADTYNTISGDKSLLGVSKMVSLSKVTFLV
jgi:hypothetical protein